MKSPAGRKKAKDRSPLPKTTLSPITLATPTVLRKTVTTFLESALNLDKNVTLEIPTAEAEAGIEITRIRSILRTLDTELKKTAHMAATVAMKEGTDVTAEAMEAETEEETSGGTTGETTAGTEIETTLQEAQASKMKARMTPTSKQSSVHCMIK